MTDHAMTLRLALLAFCLAGPSVHRVDAQPRSQEAFLTRAVFVESDLWVLSDAGQLSRITAGSTRAVREDLPEPARDLCLLDGRPAVVTCPAKGCGAWTLRRHTGAAWSVVTTVPQADDRLLGLVCSTSSLQVLTTRRLIAIDGGAPHPIALSDPLAPRGVVSLHANARSVFVGVNHGEFGGGLQTVDRASGRVRRVEHNSTGELCGGPLNTDCDPVTGVAAAPGRPECVVAAIGLVHFRARGRLIEVCGDQVRQVSPESAESVAFFGLTSDGQTLWSAGTDGIYRIDRNGVHRAATMPTFAKVGPFDVSFALPGVALVLTLVNQRASVSGAAAMLVPHVSTEPAPSLGIRTGTAADFAPTVPVCIEASGARGIRTIADRIETALKREFKGIAISCSTSGERLVVTFQTGHSVITHSNARGPRYGFGHVAVVRAGGYAAEAEIHDDIGGSLDDVVSRFSHHLVALLKSAAVATH
jgi:hypothetical protein